ncbi:MAG: hypothetical protein LH473_12225, partial [Chitinophagales bacterium]|nr:hypothetical protein [Chitinophagales bacterium]
AYTDGGMTWNGSGAVYIDSNRAIFGQVSIWVDGVRKRNYVVQLNAPRLKNNLVNGTVNISCACTDPLYPWSICWRESLSAGSHIIEVKGKVYRASSYLKNATYQKRTKIAFSQKQISPFGGYYFDWGWLVAGLIKT